MARKEPKIKGFDASSLIGLGGGALAVSAVVLYGRSESAFMIREYRVPGAVIPGIVLLLAAVIVSLGKRYGSRAALVGGGLLAVAVAALSVWGRFGNLSEIRDAGVDLQPGFWLGMGGSVLAVAGGLAGILTGALAARAEAPTIEVATPAAAATPAPAAVPSPAPAAVAWEGTSRVPAGGMPATGRPDPTADIILTLEPGLPIQVLQRRGDWALVRTPTGWEGWVDARKLEPIAAAVA